jgi:nitrogen fixation protein NifU and related proteins
MHEAMAVYGNPSSLHARGREDKARIVCQCMNVTDHEIEDAVLEGARTFQELQEHTKLGTVCGQCEGKAREHLDAAIQKHFPPTA